MVLIICPECENKISDKSDYCVNCGCPMEEITKIQKAREKIRQSSGIEHFNLMIKSIGCEPLKEKFDFEEFEEKIIKVLEYCYKKGWNIDILIKLSVEEFVQNVYIKEKNVHTPLKYYLISTLLNRELKNKKTIVKEEFNSMGITKKLKLEYVNNVFMSNLGFYQCDVSKSHHIIFNNKEEYDKFILKNKYNNELYIAISESILSLVVNKIILYIDKKSKSIEKDLIIMWDSDKEAYYKQIKNKITKIYERNILNLGELTSFNLIFIEDEKPEKLDIFLTYDCFFAMLNLKIDYNFKKITIENKDRYYYLTKKDEVNVIYDCIKCNNNDCKIHVKMSEQSELFKQMHKKSYNAKEFINESVSLIEIEELNEKINTIIKRINKLRVEISELDDIVHENRRVLFGKRLKEREDAENRIAELKVKVEEEKIEIHKLINKFISKIKEDAN